MNPSKDNSSEDLWWQGVKAWRILHVTFAENETFQQCRKWISFQLLMICYNKIVREENKSFVLLMSCFLSDFVSIFSRAFNYVIITSLAWPNLVHSTRQRRADRYLPCSKFHLLLRSERRNESKFNASLKQLYPFHEDMKFRGSELFYIPMGGDLLKRVKQAARAPSDEINIFCAILYFSSCKLQFLYSAWFVIVLCYFVKCFGY